MTAQIIPFRRKHGDRVGMYYARLTAAGVDHDTALRHAAMLAPFAPTEIPKQQMIELLNDVDAIRRA